MSSTGAAQSVATPEALQDVGLVRSVFEKVVAAVEASPSLTEPAEPSRIDRGLVRTLREAYQAVARLTLLNELAANGEPESNEKDSPGGFLEAEVLAIYW